ncbi:DUF2868 domain-containing protein [Comamonas guangdongensis]|uniref:DUF2868 domain-containing protein n=1 Tax=Comamonas guangdongensis TaxID=510515 RepID=A0ABV3ZTK0_9BURK
MKASSAREIVFAHALETAAAHEALPTAERCTAITQEALHALGKEQGRGQAGFERFLQQRARRIIAAASLPAEIAALWQQAAGVSRWAVAGVLALAFALGFAGHAITDPHRVDLLSPALIGIVAWNLLVYVLLLLAWLRGRFQRRKSVVPLLAPTRGEPALAAQAPTSAWRQKLQARKWPLSRATGLRKMALNFERNWWQLNQRSRHAQWVMSMHLGAALLALGALASLWFTGLTRAYQVGWESTFLSPAAVQTCLNLLFAPVQHLLGVAPWSLDEIQALQGWAAQPEAAAGMARVLEPPTAGALWVQRYTLLLGCMVLLPRLLLALWQGVRVWWLGRHLELPLQQPYFLQLQRDWAGRATALQLRPYSLEITAQREAVLRRHVAHSYGAGARLTLLPALAYGAPLSEAGDGSAQQVLLLNLAATPEAEIHGALLAQVANRWGTQAVVWLWAEDFRARNSGAPARVQEREHLWQEFVRSAGLNATLVPAAGV